MRIKLARGMENHAVKPWDAYIVVSRELAQCPGLELAVHRHNCDPANPHSPNDVQLADFTEFCEYIMRWLRDDLYDYDD